MSWTNLPTDYADATWTGDRKYTINLNDGGGNHANATITDTTTYEPTTSGGTIFYGANDANQTNDAINKIVSALGNDINDLKVNVANGGTGATTAADARTNLGVTGVVLYNNDSGTSSAITLSDSAANYNRLKIYYSNDDSQYFDLEIASPNGKSSILSSKRIVSSNSTLYIKTCQISISGTSITFDSANYGMYRITTSGNAYNHEQKFKIHRVVGYKY